MTIRELIESDGFPSKKKASTHGGEYAGRCPWCGGDDRFLCWPEQGEFGEYWCRKCGRGGDAIQYLRDHRHMTFKEACQFLGKEMNYQSSTPAGGRTANKSQREPRTTAAPNALWQAKARELVAESVRDLWAPYSKLALDLLIKDRGLTEATIKEFSLGCILNDQWETAPEWGLEEVLKDNGKAKKLWFPRGHVISLWHGDQILRVRIRRPKAAGDPRYYVLRGSDTRAMVLGVNRSVSIIVESELDALLLHQEVGDLVNVISLGNAQTRPDQGAAEILKQSQLILVALDADQAGAAEFWRWWKEHYPQARRWPPVAGKDPGDMLAAGVSIKKWIEAGLTEYRDVTIQPEHPLPLAGREEELVAEESYEPNLPSPPATCESCPWYTLNPWTRDPALGAWCHRRMEPLPAASPACEKFCRGEVPARHPHKQVPAVPSTTPPDSPESSFICADCPHFQPNNGRNPRQGWGRCLKRNRGRFGCATACAAAQTDEGV